MDVPNVNTLLYELCEHIFEANARAQLIKSERGTYIKKLRTRAWSVILKESAQCLEKVRKSDPVTDLLISAFNAKEHSWNHANQLVVNARKIQTLQFYNNSDFMAVLHFLVKLSNFEQEEKNVTVHDCRYCKEWYGTSNNTLGARLFCIPELKAEEFDNHAPSPFFLTPEFDCSLQVSASSPTMYKDVPGAALKLPTFNMTPPPFPFMFSEGQLQTGTQHYFPTGTNQQDQNGDEGYVSPSHEKTVFNKESQSVTSTDYTYKTWACLGEEFSELELPNFLEGPQEAILKQWTVAASRNSTSPAKVTAFLGKLSPVSILDLISDIKYLLLGIETTSYIFNQEHNEFEINNMLCVESITPETLKNFSEDLIYCGTLCRKIRAFVQLYPHGEVSARKGLIFMALGKYIDQFLVYYYNAVYSLMEDITSLLMIKDRLFCDLRVQLWTVYKFCKEPDSSGTSGLLMGNALFPQLYYEISNATNEKSVILLYSALQSCCTVYFRFLQTWLFEGTIEDDYEEFFIRKVDLPDNGLNRRYWTKSLVILESEVPGFLRGLEEKILECGKTLNLLKLCNPCDPLCLVLQEGYPDLVPCFTTSSIRKTEQQYGFYVAKAVEACGENISISKIFDHRANQEKAFASLVQHSNQETLIHIERKRQTEAVELAQQKYAQFLELKEQMNFTAEQKKKEEAKLLEEEVNYLRQVEQLQKEEDQRIHEAMVVMSQHFESLNKVTDKKKFRDEWKLRRHDLQEKRSKFWINDTISQNEGFQTEAFDHSVAETLLENCEDISESCTEVVESNKLDTSEETRLSVTGTIDAKYVGSVTEDNLRMAKNGLHCDDQVSSVQNISIEEEQREVAKENAADVSFCDSNILERHCYEPDELDLSINTATSSLNTSPASSLLNIIPNSDTDVRRESLEKAIPNTPNFVGFSSNNDWLCNPFHDRSKKLDVKSSADEFTEEDVQEIELSLMDKALRHSILIPLRIQAKLVNDAILKYFLVDQDLLSHLDSLRMYYFLMDGDFGHNLVNGLFQKMHEVAGSSQLLNHLDSLLKNALATTVKCTRTNGDRLILSLTDTSSKFNFSSPHVPGCFILKYQTFWPLNIIITEETLSKYNEVFSFLLKLQHISWTLENTCRSLKQSEKTLGISSRKLIKSPQYHHVQLWRYEMTQFISALHNYVRSAILQSTWVEFQTELLSAMSLESLYRTHVAYVKKVLFRFLMTKHCAPVLKVLYDIFGMILRFHEQLHAKSWLVSQENDTYIHPNFMILSQVSKTFQDLTRYLFKVATKLATMGYEPHLFELLTVLNINNYYYNPE